jgi:hypothetical protein
MPGASKQQNKNKKITFFMLSLNAGLLVQSYGSRRVDQASRSRLLAIGLRDCGGLEKGEEPSAEGPPPDSDPVNEAERRENLAYWSSPIATATS